MGDVIDELLARDDVGTNDPASLSDIDAVLRYFDAPLPELLVKFWRASDGVTLEQLDAHLLGPTEVRQLLADGTWNEELVERGFVPVLDDHQSNYLVVIVRDPLAFRVAHVSHEGDSRLLYRDFESCASDLLRVVDLEDSADMYLHDAEGDYAPDAPRLEEDQYAARELLRTPGEQEEWDYAVQLMDASNLPEWAKLLETDHFIRQVARARMQKMSSPAIRELLRNQEAAFEEFATLAADAARQARLEVRRREGDMLLVGSAWMNLRTFFHRRNIPNAVPRMIAWLEDNDAGRNPRHRPGHFMAD
ncbi:MAG TPA: SMI1/KNR4 family protein [Longimicrobium sp.]